ncbi:MAG TPA: hypothetical protein VF277_05170 [Steroidobacteraceae bacterium]
MNDSILDGINLVDHHCHGVVREALDRPGFESLLTEADAAGAWHGTMFDTRAGLAVRSRCAPLLDLPPHVDPETYLACRAALGTDEVGRRLLRSTGIDTFCVDTGFLADRLTSPAELAGLAGASRYREIVRLETVAEQVIVDTDGRGFTDACGAVLTERSHAAVGWKSVAAYRVGLDLDPARPADVDVAAAATAWRQAIDDGGPVRLTDSVIVRWLIWTGIDLRLPLQFHVGYGDRDVELARCDPLLLMPMLRATATANVPIMLLHNYPFHRHAAYLAQVFDHVFVDVGLAIQNVGGAARTVLAELLELAPFGSVLFSTDGFGLPELYVVSTCLFREALTAFLDDGIDAGEWGAADARRIAEMICASNATRAYGLREDAR